MKKPQKNQVLVTGGRGNLAKEFRKKYPWWLYLDENELDVTDKKQAYKIFKKTKPKIALHLAAYTNVQKAEDEKELCHKVNIAGTRNIARACLQNKCVLIHASTHYIYTGEIPFTEANRITAAQSDYYSQTKYKAEKEIQRILRGKKFYILRLGNVFGGDNDRKITTILINWDKPEFNALLRYIHPTYAPDIAEIVGEYFIKPIFNKFSPPPISSPSLRGRIKEGVKLELPNTNIPPHTTYNIANEGYCTVYDYAKTVFEILGKNIKVNAVDEIKEKVKRRSYAMDLSRLKKAGISPRRWQEALKEYLI